MMKNETGPIPRRSFLASTAGLTTMAVVPRLFAADEDPPKGLRVFTCGHSFHVWVAPMLVDLAEAAGIEGHQLAGVSSIGGSRVLNHWAVPEERNEAKKALKEGSVDVLTLSPIWLPDDGIENFAKLAFAGNSGIRITIQEYWLPNDEYHPVYPLETRKKVDHDATDLAALREANARYEEDIEEHVRGINQALGKDVLVTVPVGAASIALRERIVAGKVKELKTQGSLFTDSWGHPTTPLKVLAAYCHYAVIYRRSPVGLRQPKELARFKGLASDPLNQLLQELAWEAVTAKR